MAPMRLRLVGGVLSAAVWAVVLGAAPGASGSDVIYRRSTGKAIGGEITASTKDEITVKPTNGNPVAIPASDVAKVEWEGEPGAMRLGRVDEEGGRYDRALQNYAKAKSEAKSPSARFQVDLEYFPLRVRARQELANPSDPAAARAALEAFRKKNSDSHHYYECTNLIGQLFLAEQDLASAQAAFDELAGAAASDLKLLAQLQTARLKLAANDAGAARELFAAVAGAAPSGLQEEAYVHQGRLGLADCLKREQKYEEAIRTLNEILAAARPEDSRTQAEAYLQQGDCLQASGRPKEALLAYLHVDLLFSTEKAQHAEALYHLSRLWDELQKPERGADCAQRLLSEYPNSPWSVKLRGTN